VRNLIRSYSRLESHILNAIVAEFFIQLINASFMAVQLIYMQKSGFSDHEGAGFISFRFLGVLLLAVPLGLYIKGRKIKWLFYLSGFLVPFFGLLILYSISHRQIGLLYLSQLLWGTAFTFIQIPIMPYILRNSKKENQTEAISLSYSTWSFAGIFSGILIYALSWINPVLFDDKTILMIIAVSGFASLYFISKIRIEEHVPEMTSKRLDFSDFDWLIIIKALIPTLIIAVGAGLTIPFISIFFYNVHHMDTEHFAVLNAISAVFVAIGSMLVPQIKRGIGYKVAIPTTQSFAVIALVLLATTQFYADVSIAIYIAMLCFILRQPLMNMAGPMTSEIVMNYVGKRNQEIVSALTSAIWSGSWFISSRIFKELRETGFAYVNVFLITAILYGLGVVWYYFLILDYQKREKMGLIEA
jgi:predicted MFS family arabinose efflux permease